MTVDRNDAPAGYEAHASRAGCDECAFGDRRNGCIRKCLPWLRADGQDVIFIKRNLSRPRVTLTGGRKIAPPEWAKHVALYFRDCGKAGPFHISEYMKTPESTMAHKGIAGDFLSVEWLP